MIDLFVCKCHLERLIVRQSDCTVLGFHPFTSDISFDEILKLIRRPTKYFHPVDWRTRNAKWKNRRGRTEIVRGNENQRSTVIIYMCTYMCVCVRSMIFVLRCYASVSRKDRSRRSKRARTEQREKEKWYARL